MVVHAGTLYRAVLVAVAVVAVAALADTTDSKERFRALGRLYLHRSGLRTEGCDADRQHCTLRFGEPQRTDGELHIGNVSLAYVSERVELPRADDASSGMQEASVDLQCYVGRHRFPLADAYHASTSMHRLSEQILIDLHGRKASADAAMAHEGLQPATLLHGSVLATHQVHHRLRNLAKRKQEVAAMTDVTPDDPPDPIEEQMLNDLRRDANIQTHDTVSQGSPFGRLTLSAASPQRPFVHTNDVFRRILQDEDTLPAFVAGASDVGLEGVRTTSHKDTDHTYTVPGDVVVGRYLRTNNWKFCRNVQHGMYFNASARRNSVDGDHYYEHRCVVAQFLNDVCWLVEAAEDGLSWRIVGGCANNDGAALQYTSLKNARFDANEPKPTTDGMYLPLTMRVCHKINDNGVPSGTGASFVDERGFIIPSYEYVRRVVLERFEANHKGRMHVEDAAVSLDWRRASFEGRAPTEGGSWSVVFWTLGGFVLLMIVVAVVVTWL